MNTTTITPDTENRPAFSLLCTIRAFESAFNHELQGSGVTFRQAQVLSRLSAHGDLSQTELAEKMQIEPSTLVRILDRMEKNGWIARHDSPTDRRKKVIRATAKVQPEWAHIQASKARVEQRAVRGLSPQQIETLQETLELIRANLTETR
jgi:MarR family transcriptional regulator for hemolysin